MSRKKTERTRAYWVDRGWQPVYIAYVPDERAWRSEMKRLHVKPRAPWPTSAGNCAIFARTEDGGIMCLVSLRRHKKMPAGQVVGLLTHECVHVWQQIKEHIGETAPGHEMEAYAIQSITQDIIAAYEKAHGRLFRSRK